MKCKAEKTYTLTLTEKEMKFLVICLGATDPNHVKRVANEKDSDLDIFNAPDFYKAFYNAYHGAKIEVDKNTTDEGE